jgi:hypothetical protein
LAGIVAQRIHINENFSCIAAGAGVKRFSFIIKDETKPKHIKCAEPSFLRK